jgi:hypothetical protein
MKQIIVLVSMIALGIAIAGFVMGFQSSAESLVDAAQSKIQYEEIVAPSNSGG